MEDESNLEQSPRPIRKELEKEDLDASIEDMADLETAFESSSLSSPKLNKADYAVLRYLYSEYADVPANIADASDYNRTYIHQRLTRLEEWGLVHNRGNGVYELDWDVVDVVRVAF